MKAKIIGAGLVTLTVLTCGTALTASAANIDSANSPSQRTQATTQSTTAGSTNRQSGSTTSSLEQLLREMVQSGAITTAEAEEIRAAVTSNDPESVKAALDSFVTDGTLSQAEENALLSRLNIQQESGSANASKRTPLREDNTITEAQQQAVTQVLSTKTTGTQDTASYKALLDKLVSNGTITQAQEDAILLQFQS